MVIVEPRQTLQVPQRTHQSATFTRMVTRIVVDAARRKKDPTLLRKWLEEFRFQLLLAAGRKKRG